MIRTESNQFSYLAADSHIYSFNVPAFSEIKKIYLVDNYLYMIIDFPEEYNVDASKLINLKVQSVLYVTEDLIYKYFDTQVITKTEIVNNSYGSNIQFSTINLNQPYHFFIQEIKPQLEIRDSKIETIIND